MELIKHTIQWAEGDALQGKIMLAVGILLLTAGIFIFKSENQVLRGMLIPIALIVIVGAGYGGFLTFSRPNHPLKVEVVFKTDPAKAITMELEKATRDNKAYSIAKKVWPALIALCSILIFFISKEYWQGLLLGLTGLFFFILLVDIFLHRNLKPYIEVLEQLS